MIRAMFRALVRGILALVVLIAVFAAVILYRSGKLPYQEAVEDAAIVGSAKAAYALHRQLSERAIRIESRAGRVVLKGAVASESEKKEAEEIARNLDGVREVENQLAIESPIEPPKESSRSLGEKFDDVTLLAKVRAALSLDREARAVDLDVIVRDGEVVLRGNVPTDELEKRILERVGSIEGVESVELLRSDESRK